MAPRRPTHCNDCDHALLSGFACTHSGFRSLPNVVPGQRTPAPEWCPLKRSVKQLCEAVFTDSNGPVEHPSPESERALRDLGVALGSPATWDTAETILDAIADAESTARAGALEEASLGCLVEADREAADGSACCAEVLSKASRWIPLLGSGRR